MSNSFFIFLNVIKAIFIKEMNLRLGRLKLSYLEIAAEPLIPILLFGLIHFYIGHGKLSTEDYIVFLFSGFLIYSTMKNMVTKASDAIESNQGLFLYKQVKPFDAILGRLLADLFTFFLSFLLYLFIGSFYLENIIPYDIGGVLIGYSLIIAFALSLSFFVASIAVYLPSFKRLTSLSFIPLMFFSAIFYTIDTLPFEFQKYMLYNPLAQVMELIHGSWLHSLHTYQPDYVYIGLWITIPMCIGILNYFYISRPILMKR